MSDTQLSLFDAPEPAPGVRPASDPAPGGGPGSDSSVAPDADALARAFAVDPRNNVVLEASAGTGKTSVLVARYVNLLKAGVEPSRILAITFTRKAAAEMRERIVRELRDAAARSESACGPSEAQSRASASGGGAPRAVMFDRKRWLELRDRLGEIAISTIDAFCLSLLKEFPLEADLDPGFDIADETEVPRLVDEALDRAMRILGGLAAAEPDIALVLAQLGVARTRDGLALLIERRLVARDALDRFLANGPRDLTAAAVCRRAADSLLDTLRAVPGGLPQFLQDGPRAHPRYALFLREIDRLRSGASLPDAVVRGMLERIGSHFLTNEGAARQPGSQIYPYRSDHYPSKDAAKRHRDGLFQVAPQVENVIFRFNRDLNVILARGIRRMFAVALDQYRRALDERSVLDFSDILQRALDLLRRMDEFSQSRFRMESRYHHVLVDEFQDTSRAQWELVALLIQSWGEGLGLASNPSIFVVGDRKQSIYRFRDAEVAVLSDAGRYIEALRPGSSPRRSITRSFRAVPELLSFVNDVFIEMSKPAARPDEFTYTDDDRFPVGADEHAAREPVLGIAVAETPELCAAAVADEIARILREETVRDRRTGVRRQATAGDIAILFRSRASHREFERELTLRRIPTYVYKGLGFFDADEIKDVTALMRYLADPASDLRAAAFLRSRFIRLSDAGLAALAPAVARALTDELPAEISSRLSDEDRRVLDHARRHVGDWIASVDLVPPADLIEAILHETAYAFELAGARRLQAWENLKKMRGLVRRIQNRGYATLRRIADHIDALSAGDESNAVVEALDAVNLMTVHASKGLEFPIVFVVNIAKGASGPPRPVRVIPDEREPSVTVGPFISEMDDADRDRERHETRRLLYVALTRARDRLYLSTAMKEGIKFAPGRGSLGEVVPESIAKLFVHAATAFEEFPTVSWTGASGHSYEWRLCRAGAHAPAADPASEGCEDIAPYLGPLLAGPTDVRVPVTSLPVVEPAPPMMEVHGSAPPKRNVHGPAAPKAEAGRLVHRLFQFSGELRGQADDTEAAEARRVWEQMRSRPDVAAALHGRRLYEVPFSMATTPGTILRGAIDCLVERPDGSLVVVEFKTGVRQPRHEQQLEIYVQAVRQLFPGRPVHGVLLYPS